MKKQILILYLSIFLPSYPLFAGKDELSTSPKIDTKELLKKIKKKLNESKKTASDSTEQSASCSSTSSQQIQTADIDKENDIKWKKDEEIRRILQINPLNQTYIDQQLILLKENAEKARENMTIVFNNFFNAFVKPPGGKVVSSFHYTDETHKEIAENDQNKGTYSRYHDMFNTRKTLGEFYEDMGLDSNDMIDLVRKIEDSIAFCSTLIVWNELKFDSTILEIMYYYKEKMMNQLVDISNPAALKTFNEFLEQLDLLHLCLSVSRAIFGPFVIISNRLSREKNQGE